MKYACGNPVPPAPWPAVPAGDARPSRPVNDLSHLSREELIQRLQAAKSPADGATAALRNSERRLRALFDHAVEGMITIDERGLIESVNPAAEKMFGYAGHELLGKNVSLLMPPPDREQHDQYLRNYLETGRARIIGQGREVIAQRRDGSTFPVDLSVSEFHLDEGRRFIGVLRDITVRKRLEKEVLEAVNREQARIGQDLHDGLGQHLAGIEFMSRVLEQKLAGRGLPEADKAAEIARLVREAIAHTRQLASGLSPVMLEPDGLSHALAGLAAGTGKIYQIRARFECRRPVQVNDNTVATHLFRIAQEAVANAVKHGRAREIIIRLEESRGRLLLAVHDDGLGIAAVAAGHRGMGLHIMHYRAGIIGGSLVVQRNPEGGTSVVCSVEPTSRPARNQKE